MSSRASHAESGSRHKRYFYQLLAHHLSFYLPALARVAEIRPQFSNLRQALRRRAVAVVAPAQPDDCARADVTSFAALKAAPPDRILMNTCLHFADDVQELLEQVRAVCTPDTRVLLTYYSSVWKPIIALAARFGLADTGG